MTPGRARLPLRVEGTWFGFALAAALSAAVAGASPARAAEPRTYFIAETGNDGASGLQGSPWRSLARAWQAVAAGDTIVVGDGSYTNASPPPGKAGLLSQPITVRAANPGLARLDLLGFRGNSHLAFVGFRIDAGRQAVAIASDGPERPSHHLTFQQIGFSCVPDTVNNDACFGLSDGTHHVLLEDSWGWGGGRYTILCYGGPGGKPANVTCDRNTFRRVVLRQGPTRSSPGAPQASIALYYASNNLIENVLAIDGLHSSESSNAAFYIPTHAPPPSANYNKYYGVIALNNRGTGFYMDCDGICRGAEVHNSVFWQNARGIVVTGKRDPCDAIISGNTVGRSYQHGYHNYRCMNASLTQNVFVENGGIGAVQDRNAGSTVASRNGYFGNAKGPRSDLPAGAGDLTTDPGIKHITRIEAGSAYKSAGIGANVLNRYENGVQTTTPLWPWPHEDRIRAEMCAGVTSGFCASGKSLTRYVWEHLGNPTPAGIYP